MDTDRQRRSARQVTFDLASELLARTQDIETNAKLQVIETIAYRMGWTELYNRIRFRERKQPWWVEK